ncbi:MAG: GNAT family N-acetyltransferase [Firmicutes bacterium]|nr:GNAT family N-acetyltransferase [Bacillota bacterium]
MMEEKYVIAAGALSEANKKEIEELEAQGYRLAAKNKMLRHRVPKAGSDIEKDFVSRHMRWVGFQTLINENLHLEYCDTPELAEKVCALWKSELKPTDIPEEHFDFLNDPDTVVLCATDDSGNVAGAAWLRFSGKNAEKRHIVTAPEWRRKSVAYALENAVLAECILHGSISLNTWVAEDNLPSLGLHEKMGYQDTGAVSWQYVKD